MTLKRGDLIGGRFEIHELVAVSGEHDDCQNPMCTRMGFGQDATDLGRCVGYHCPRCGLPCSSHGHDCENAIAAAWRRERGEGGWT